MLSRLTLPLVVQVTSCSYAAGGEADGQHELPVIQLPHIRGSPPGQRYPAAYHPMLSLPQSRVASV